MTKSQNQMWGGRFAAGPDAIMEAINASIGFDQRMAAQDIQGSRAHAAMLGAAGIFQIATVRPFGKGSSRFYQKLSRAIFRFGWIWKIFT